MKLECGSRCGVACRKITEPVSSLVAVQSAWRPKGDKKRKEKRERENGTAGAKRANLAHGRLYFPSD